ncbi:MAG: AI-2E family transporter [Helicobacteraceae bacterium]|nr:AI-2E family transporter [Helicobacteraceae bacterium]
MKQEHLVMGIFLVTLYAMFVLYEPFLMNISIATLLALSTTAIHQKFISLTHSDLIASVISTTLLALLFFVPIGYFLGTFTVEINALKIEQLQKIYTTLEHFALTLPDVLKPMVDKLKESNFETNIATYAISFTTTIGKHSGGFIKDSLLIILFYFFVLYYGREMVRYIVQVSGLEEKHTTQVACEISTTMSVVFYSVILTAMLEGALFGMVISYLGYNGILFGIMYGFASFIPVVGGVLMWVPFSIYEYSVGHEANAILLAIYSIVVISILADTILKPLIIRYIGTYVVKMKVKTNELIIFFSILAGLASFGFWGMIIGPAITSFFLAILRLIEVRQKSLKELVKSSS